MQRRREKGLAFNIHSLLLLSALILPLAPSYSFAQSQQQMLPPTLSGTNTPCNTNPLTGGGPQLLVYTGQPTISGLSPSNSSINCAGAYNNGAYTNPGPFINMANGFLGIGIGMNNPAYPIDVSGGIRIYQGTGAGGGFIYLGNGNDMQFDGGTDGQFWIKNTGVSTGGTYFVNTTGGALWIGNNSQVGVDTATPQATLDVNGTMRIGGSATIGQPCITNGLLEANSTGTGALLTCISGKWQSLNKPTLAQTESFTCGVGANNSPPPCYNAGNNISKQTASVHDFCALSTVAGWAGGLYGQCVVTGTPGNVWTLQASSYGSNQTDCTITCYDFQ